MPDSRRAWRLRSTHGPAMLSCIPLRHRRHRNWWSSRLASRSGTARPCGHLPRADGPDRLTIEQLLWLHTVAITEFGGASGVRDRGLLESALARPLAAFGGHRPFETPLARAAALAEALIQNHGFVDGNKRAAVYAMGWWLE